MYPSGPSGKVSVRMCVRAWVRLCAHVCESTCIRVCKNVGEYVPVCVRAHVSVYIHVAVCEHVNGCGCGGSYTLSSSPNGLGLPPCFSLRLECPCLLSQPLDTYSFIQIQRRSSPLWSSLNCLGELGHSLFSSTLT